VLKPRTVPAPIVSSSRCSARGDGDAREAPPVEVECSLPGGAGLLVRGSLLVVEEGLEEPVPKARIDVELVLDARGQQPRGQLLDVLHADTTVLIAPVAEDRTVHLRRHLDR